MQPKAIQTESGGQLSGHVTTDGGVDMKRRMMACSFVMLACFSIAEAGTYTYNELTVVNMRDQGLPADERATKVLVAEGDFLYGATSGDQCHVFRFDPATSEITVLATLPGPNTVMRGLVVVSDTIYVGTMWTKRQVWLNARKTNPDCDIEDANLLPIEDACNTGHLYRISGISGGTPQLADVGVPVPNQGIHTMAADPGRGLIYGVTSPNGRFFVHDTRTNTAEHTAFGRTYTTVSNHMVGYAEVERELSDLVPGEGEWNNRLIPMAMHVAVDGTLYTSGGQGKILRYDPNVTDIQERFSELGWIPSVPGRQYWNRIDAIIEHDRLLYMGTSDGYVLRVNPETNTIENLGKPIRAIEVMGMAFSPLDGRLYGVSGGGLEGMSRFWVCDVENGTFEIDYPPVEVLHNRRRVGDVVCTRNGTIVMAQDYRVADLLVLAPGEGQEWEKTGLLEEINPQESRQPRAPDGRFDGHKKLEVDVFPMPSSMHGGSGYTAIQADNDGRVYVGTAYYGKNAQLVQLDPKTAAWRSIFQSDELTYQYGRGQGIPGKIHTKLRRGADGRIYGAMKQGYEQQYTLRPDVGEAPEGVRGSQFTCYAFSYDPVTDTTVNLGPGWPQEGITAFDVDTDRGYVYAGTVPGVFFLVYDLGRRRVWNAGQIKYAHPTRYMPMDPGTGKVYHPGEVTPDGAHFMTVWEPEPFRLRDHEVVAEEDFAYRHSYAACCGPAGTQTLYGLAGGTVFEMDLDTEEDGKLHVRPVCTVGVDGDEQHSGMYAIECGPDGRIYWASSGGRNIPLDLFAYDPKTEEKTYLGACALGGEWIAGGHCQGICLDPQGNLSLHMLYAEISKEQRKLWSVPDDFFYEDVPRQSHYLGYPGHLEDTFYAVYRVKNATAIR
jgi:hypothetical protein